MSSSSSLSHRSIITSGLIVITVLFPVLSFIALFLRYKARRALRQSFFADDYWALAAWIATIPLSINIWVFAGLIGVDHYNVALENGIIKSHMAIFVSSVILPAPLSAVKISILLLYRRIFVLRPFQIVAMVSACVVACWGIVFFFLVLFQSDPVQASWTGMGHFNTNPLTVGYAQVGTSIGLDVAVLCMPIPIVVRLQMPLKRKLAVMMIFWLGAFCCIAAIIRLYYLHSSIAKVEHNPTDIYLQWRNFAFMIIEPNCSIIAACLPTLAPLIRGKYRVEALVRLYRSIVSSRGSETQDQPSNWPDAASPRNLHSSPPGIRLETQPQSNRAMRRMSTDSSQAKSVEDVDESNPKNPEIVHSSINVTRAVTITSEDNGQATRGGA